ncbi:MAG TPA: hypothetical protein VL961_12440, partial [Acidimicrobiales bacterium]|nr:hypothetical protein [Acidimicrobiales bacterium]
MRVRSGRAAVRAWMRLPRRTARLRLTVLYGGLFLVSGAALVAVTYALYEHATAFTSPRLPKVPKTPTLATLPFQSAPSLPTGSSNTPAGLSETLPKLQQIQHQLS